MTVLKSLAFKKEERKKYFIVNPFDSRIHLHILYIRLCAQCVCVRVCVRVWYVPLPFDRAT